MNETDITIATAVRDMTDTFLKAAEKIMAKKEEKTTTWVMPDGKERTLKTTLAAVLEMIEETAGLINTEKFTKEELAEIGTSAHKIMHALLEKCEKLDQPRDKRV